MTPVEQQPEAKSQVEIADIFYRGSVKRVESDEYIEIANQGTEPADLSGWRISAGEKGQDFSFPAGAVLQPGKSFRVYTDEVHPEWGGYSFGIKRSIWNNKGDTGRLYDAAGNLVSARSYGNAAQKSPVTPSENVEEGNMSLEADIQKVKDELGVPALTVVADPQQVADQTALGGSVSFAEALRSAIASVLEYADRIDSLVGLVQNDPATYELAEDADVAAITEFLRERLNQPSSQVILLDPEYEFLPEEGETVDENWLFRLKMPDTFSGLTWAIVPRSGSEPAYNYNFD